MANDSDDDESDDDETYYEYLKEQRATFPHQMPDIILAVMVLSGEETEMWLTVLIGGVWMTGRIASYADWLAALMTESKELRVMAAEAHAEAQIQPIGAEKRKHLHLLDVEVMTNAGNMSPIGAPFRCRLVDVQGWLLGKIATTVGTT